LFSPELQATQSSMVLTQHLDDICHASRVMDGTGVGHEIR